MTHDTLCYLRLISPGSRGSSVAEVLLGTSPGSRVSSILSLVVSFNEALALSKASWAAAAAKGLKKV